MDVKHFYLGSLTICGKGRCQLPIPALLQELDFRSGPFRNPVSGIDSLIL